MIDEITNNGDLLAIIISAEFNKPGIHFFTKDELSQQVAYMQHPQGTEIKPHVHKYVNREITHTQEVLLIKSGKLRVDFYDKEQVYLSSRILNSGDIILLITGGHGFEVIDNLEMIEVKQGPYYEGEHKIRFDAVDKDKIIIASK